MKLILITLLLALFLPSPLFAYSYSAAGKEQLIEGRKAILEALDAKSPQRALAELEKIAGEIQNLELPKGSKLYDPLRQALEKGNDKAALEVLNRVFAAEIKYRLGKVPEYIQQYLVAKVLITKSKLFLDLITPHMNKQSRKESLNAIKGALKSIGKPGVFGAGSTKPDPDAYAKYYQQMVQILDQAFF